MEVWLHRMERRGMPAKIEEVLMALHIPGCTLWQRVTCLDERTITKLPSRQFGLINAYCEQWQHAECGISAQRDALTTGAIQAMRGAGCTGQRY